jgi:hypothetical protein
MKVSFHLGAKVRAKGTDIEGFLVPRSSVPYGSHFPHYDGEGFYVVRWNQYGPEVNMIVHEDDLELSQ